MVCSTMAIMEYSKIPRMNHRRKEEANTETHPTE